MKPSIESPSTKTAETQPAASAGEGSNAPSPALGAGRALDGSWDWLAHARRPELWPAVLLAARPCLIVLSLLFLVGVCAILAHSKPQPRDRDGFDLLADHSSPNLNLTSAEAPSDSQVEAPQPERPAEEWATVIPEPVLPIEPAPAVVELVPEPPPPPPMVDEQVIAIPAAVDENISIRTPHRGDSPMMQHWRMLGLHTVLAGVLTAAPGSAADQKNVEPNKDDVIVKQLAELKKSIEQLNESVKTLRTDNLNADLKATKAQTEVEELKKQINQIRLDLDELKKTASTVKAFSIQPDGKAATVTGRIRLINTYVEPITVLVNNKVYHLQPQEIRLSEPVPAGNFTYEVLGVQGPRVRQLASNETFTINVHTR